MTEDEFANFLRQFSEQLDKRADERATETRQLILHVAEANRMLSREFKDMSDRHHAENQTLQARIHNENHSLLAQIHKENQSSQARFEALLERFIRPGDN